MKIYALTRKGQNKNENEDRIIVNKTILSGGFFSDEIDKGFVAVADGVGGNNAGAVASHFLAVKLGSKPHDADSLSLINQELIALSKSQKDYSNMATTLAMIDLQADTSEVSHVGNTRIYSLVNGKYLKQATKDDTTLEYLHASGRISEEDLVSFERKHEITACFGAGNPALLRIKKMPLDTKSCPFLITSDGIHDFVSLDELEDILGQETDIMERFEFILNRAIESGSVDDMSILIGEE